MSTKAFTRRIDSFSQLQLRREKGEVYFRVSRKTNGNGIDSEFSQFPFHFTFFFISIDAMPSMKAVGPNSIELHGENESSLREFINSHKRSRTRKVAKIREKIFSSFS